MRKRSLSVAVDQSERFINKFEGVASDQEDESDSDELDDQPTDAAEEWSWAEYEKLVKQLRAVLPKNDSKKAASRLKSLDWERVAFDGHSSESVRDVTEQLVKKVRKYRSLVEMLEDVLTVVKKGFGGKPKTPPSAYNFFVKEKFASTRAKHTELNAGQIFKKLSSDFAALSDKKKQKYESLAQEAREAYKLELEKFWQENPDVKVSKAPRKRPSQSKNITPFNLFCREERLDDAYLTLKELEKRWKSLELEKKIKFVRDAYRSDGSKLTKNEKNMLDKAHGKPELVPRNVSEYYLKKYAQRDNSMSVLNWRRAKVLEFKGLSKLRRLELELELRRARAEFVSNYKEYIENLPTSEKKEEIKFLQSYMETHKDKQEKQNDTAKGAADAMHDITDLPIAESTTNDIEPLRKKKTKKTIPDNNHSPKLYKSILKSPAPVEATPKRKKNEIPEETMAPPKKKHKKVAIPNADSESDSSARRGHKIAKKEKISDGDTSQDTQDNESVKPKEPKRPPNTILKYYKKYHYHGKPSKIQESFDKLSTVRKKAILSEMKDAEKKYMAQLRKFLVHLPRDEIQKYMVVLERAVKNAADSADDFESVDDDEVAADQSTKREPRDSSEDEDDDDDE